MNPHPPFIKIPSLTDYSKSLGSLDQEKEQIKFTWSPSPSNPKKDWIECRDNNKNKEKYVTCFKREKEKKLSF